MAKVVRRKIAEVYYNLRILMRRIEQDLNYEENISEDMVVDRNKQSSKFFLHKLMKVNIFLMILEDVVLNLIQNSWLNYVQF
ncbi:hypothetical protein DF214_04885 [Pectobacterium atrosepticum]|nr:hypothetical protein [Pectobacterium carotovorum subsp. carotovorum]PWD64334.1 hypothetical protein DF214_04885 [Pectobacterium atrosepticum]TAJ05004.1 hypothetical protein EG334_08555 [Pectobacterium versatile]